MHKRRAAAILLAVTSATCATRVEKPTVSSVIQDRIALCTAGFTNTSYRELAAEISRRGGELISRAEIESRGVDTFAFGEQRGPAAVDMYNAYIRCISEVQVAERTSEHTVDTDEPQPILHAIGTTPSGEAIVQVPPPGLERAGDEIQLQIVTAGGGSWESAGTPLWSGLCGASQLRRIGSDTGYVYRFFVNSRSECRITLHAVEGATVLWRTRLRVQVRQ